VVAAVSGAWRPLVGWVEMLSDERGILVVALPWATGGGVEQSRVGVGVGVVFK
jgi:hypothetical protein